MTTTGTPAAPQQETTLTQLARNLARVQFIVDNNVRLKQDPSRDEFAGELSALTTSYEQLLQRIASNDDQLTSSMTTEADRLFDKSKRLVGDLQTQVTQLNERVEKVEATTTRHTGQIKQLQRGHSDLDGRVTILEKLESFPWGRVAIAAAVGLIVGIIWSNHTFLQPMRLQDGEVIQVENVLLNGFLVSFIAGLAAGLATLGILLLIRKSAPSREVQTTPSLPVRQDATPEPVAPVAPAPIRVSATAPRASSASDDPAPTRVLQPSGAPSGGAH